MNEEHTGLRVDDAASRDLAHWNRQFSSDIVAELRKVHFGKTVAVMDAKQRPGFPTSTLEACAPQNLRGTHMKLPGIGPGSSYSR